MKIEIRELEEREVRVISEHAHTHTHTFFIFCIVFFVLYYLFFTSTCWFIQSTVHLCEVGVAGMVHAKYADKNIVQQL